MADQESPTTADAPRDGEVQEAAGSKTIEQVTAELDAVRAALAKANAEAKDNRLAKKELEQIKAAQMTDLERAMAERDELARELESARREALRSRIQASFGISDDDASVFLTGSSEDELTMQAKRLSELSEARRQPATPAPDRTQGGSGQPLALNSDALAETLARAVGAI